MVENERLAGIVTDRDLRRPDINHELEGWHEYYKLDQDYEVRDIMSRKVISVSSQDSLDKALRIFLDRKFGALPVLDKKERVIGILTSYDIMRACKSALQFVEEKAV